MKYLLDTSTCIRFLNQRLASIIARLHATPEPEIAVCSVVKAELFLGAMKSQFVSATLDKQHTFVSRFISLPFDDAAALIYAGIRAQLEQAGTPIGSNDLLIGAIAQVHNLILVTGNVREFARIEGLKVENWDEPNFS